VASPPLVDPNFDRSVVLLLEHGDDGALGIVLNRPSETDLDDVLPEWRPCASTPSVVFSGGPVSPDSVIALARASQRGADAPATDDEGTGGLVPVVGDLVTIDLALDPLDLGVPVDALRVFVGYAGWAPGQLEGEMEHGAWFVVRLASDDPFSANPERLWYDVLRRQRGRLAMFAHYPEDATVN
jgi:putative transcriptional regulator